MTQPTPAPSVIEQPALPQTLVEADGTRWQIVAGPTVAEPSHEDRTYILRRRPPGGEEVEVARVSGGSAIQENPTTSSDGEWRFYIAADGTFRAEQRSDVTREPPEATSTTLTSFRFDGHQLVQLGAPAAWQIRDHLIEADGTEWTIATSVTSSAPGHMATTYLVTRRARGGRSLEVARLGAAAFFQTNPRMAASNEWRFFIAADGTFRAENLTSKHTEHGATSHAELSRFDGHALVPTTK